VPHPTQPSRLLVLVLPVLLLPMLPPLLLLLWRQLLW
jgi:hypothetical protein